MTTEIEVIGKATFMTKANRDAKAKEMKAQGYAVRKESARNQNLHPMYVDDWPYPMTEEDKGFGNGLYMTGFSAIYTVAWGYPKEQAMSNGPY